MGMGHSGYMISAPAKSFVSPLIRPRFASPIPLEALLRLGVFPEAQ